MGIRLRSEYSIVAHFGRCDRRAITEATGESIWRREDDASLRSTFLVQPRAIFARPCRRFGRRRSRWIDSTPDGVVQRSPGLADASANPGNTTLDSRTQYGFGRTILSGLRRLIAH